MGGGCYMLDAEYALYISPGFRTSFGVTGNLDSRLDDYANYALKYTNDVQYFKYVFTGTKGHIKELEARIKSVLRKDICVVVKGTSKYRAELLDTTSADELRDFVTEQIEKLHYDVKLTYTDYGL